MLPLLEFDVGLKRSDYRDRARLAMKLQKRLANVAPDSAAQYVVILAGMLGAEGRRQDGVRLIETDAGLEPTDYNDPELLASKLHRRLETLNPEVAALYAFGLAGVLGMNELHAEALAVLEAWVDLKREDYDNPQQLVEKLHTKLHGLQPDLAIAYLMALTSLLGIANRESEVPAIFRADLGLEEGDVDPILVAVSIRNRLKGLTPSGMIAYLAAFFTLEDDPLRSRQGIIFAKGGRMW